MTRPMPVMLGLAVLGLWGCVPPAAKGPATQPAVAEAPSAEKWRPAWWHEKPAADAGRISLCAFADNPDLLTARQNAIALARRLLAEARGGVQSVDDAATRTDSVRLADGTFRAFVRLTAAG